MISNHRDNIIVGAGEMYFAALEPGGTPGAERHLGHASSASLSIQEERITVQSSSGPPRTLVDAVRSITRTLTMTLNDMSLANLAAFLGSDAALPRPAEGVKDDEITVACIETGPFYGLPSARGRAIADLVVHRQARKGGAALSEDTHYRAEPGHGRLRLLQAPGSPANGDTLYASYTVTAGKRLAIGRPQPVRGALRYIELSPGIAPDSHGRHYYAPLVSLRPAGDLSLIGNEMQALQIAALILEPEDCGAALIVDGAPHGT